MATIPGRDQQYDPCLYTDIRRAARAVAHLYDMVLSPTGLRSSQFTILRIIAESGEVAQCDLASQLALSLEALSRRLSWARKAEFLSVRHGEHGRRMYRITPLGQEKLAAVRPYWERAQSRLRKALGAEDWDLVRALVDRLVVAAQQAETLRLPNGGNLR